MDRQSGQSGAGEPIQQQRLHFCFIRLVVFGPNGIIDCPTVHSATVVRVCVCYEICIWRGLHSQLHYLLIDGCAAININRGNCQNGNELGKLCELQHVEYDLCRSCVLAFFSSTESSDSNLQLRPGLADTLPQPC